MDQHHPGRPGERGRTDAEDEEAGLVRQGVRASRMGSSGRAGARRQRRSSRSWGRIRRPRC